MKIFELTRAADAKVVHADDVNRMHELLGQAFNVEDPTTVQVTVSGVEMSVQDYDDNHADDSWDE